MWPGFKHVCQTMSLTNVIFLMFLYGTAANITPELKKKVQTLRNIQIIRSKILRTVGKTDPPPLRRESYTPATPLSVRAPDTPSLYRRIDLRSYHSEAPDNCSNKNVIQFKLYSVNSDKLMEVESVNLFIHVKYKRNRKSNVKKKRSIDTTTENEISNKNDTVDSDKGDRKESNRRNKKSKRRGRKRKKETVDSVSDTASENGNKSKHRKRHGSKSEKRNRSRRKKHLEIRLTVSNVTSNGEPGEVITSVKSKLKRTQQLTLTLPKEQIQQALQSKDHTIKFYLQCVGCGRKASLILVHKDRKKKQKRQRKRASRPTKTILQKRRPILIVQSQVSSSTVS